MGRKIISKLGEIGYNSYGSRMEIVEYNNYNNIIVQFDNGYLRKSRYDIFRKGDIKSPYDKTVYGIGYRGEGICKVISDKYGKKIKPYQQWLDMLRRCYNIKLQNKYPTYIGCSVCEEWLNFQNYYNWYIENYYEIENVQIDIDKDILLKGNKIYSPNTCIFVPHDINVLFTKGNSKNGMLLGVGYSKKDNIFISNCSISCNGIKKGKHIGSFKTELEAFNAYKEFKENYIKQEADRYKNKIPQELYYALYNYKVEITD